MKNVLRRARFALALGCASAASPATIVRAQDRPPVAVAIYREALTSDPTRYHFSFRSADEAARSSWTRVGVAFYAFANPTPGTVLVYVESPTIAPHSEYFLATCTQDEAERTGWGVRSPAFWAYPSARPGTIPVYTETPIHAPYSRYNFSTRSAAESGRDGWRTLGIAFWVPDPQFVNQPPPPQPPEFPPERQLPHPPNGPR